MFTSLPVTVTFPGNAVLERWCVGWNGDNLPPARESGRNFFSCSRDHFWDGIPPMRPMAPGGMRTLMMSGLAAWKTMMSWCIPFPPPRARLNRDHRPLPAVTARRGVLVSCPDPGHRLPEPAHVEKAHRLVEEAFVVFTVPKFSFKPREQAASNKKAYAVDTGLVDALGAGLSPNWGRLFENLVAIQLFRRQLRGEIRFFFWKDPHGIEADFVVQEGLAIRQILQVSLDTADPKTRQREIRGLCKASRDLGCGNLLLLTEKEEGQTEETWEGSVYAIRTMPIWKWLLEAEKG